MKLDFKTIYLVAITAFFMGLILFFNLRVRIAERSRLKNIRKREINDAVETESPFRDQEKVLKEKGIAGIEDRFSFIRSSLPIILISIWAIFILIPFLDRMPAVYISLFVTVVSVILGFSLRPFLENLFSGVVISFFKAIKVGDTVIIDGHYGLFEKFGLTHSVLKRWDWNRIVIPNSKLLQKEIQNLTMNENFIWAYVEFFVAPNSDIGKVKEIAKSSALKSSYISNVEEPTFWVIEMKKDTVKCWISAWADSPAHAWELKNDISMSLISSFQKEGIYFHQHYVLKNFE